MNKINKFFKDKKEKILKGEYKKAIIFIFIFALFFSFGFVLKQTVFKPKIVKPKDIVKKENQEYKKAEEAKKELENENISSVDKRLTINISQEIKNQINFKNFKEDFSKFLDENKLYTENTTATSSGDFTKTKEGELIFNLELNNNDKTNITVTIKDNKYMYEYR